MLKILINLKVQKKLLSLDPVLCLKQQKIRISQSLLLKITLNLQVADAQIWVLKTQQVLVEAVKSVLVFLSRTVLTLKNWKQVDKISVQVHSLTLWEWVTLLEHCLMGLKIKKMKWNLFLKKNGSNKCLLLKCRK